MKPKRPSQDIQSLKSYQGKKEKSHFFGLFHRDYWRGRRDGKRAPSAWQASLGTIQSEELRQKNEVRSGLNQMMGEAKTNLAHIDKLLGANEQKMDALREEDGLLAEGAAESVLSSARMEVVFASLLMICEMTGLAFIAKSTFGQGLIPALVIAVLLSSLVALGVKLLLGRVSPERKNQIKWMVLVLGLILTGVGLVGFVVLRAQTFDSGLMGGNMNFNQVSLGNLLLMTGLTLGVPLICGVLYEDAHEKMNLAKNSLRLYREREEIGSVANDWNVIVSKLEELDAQLDAVTDQVIAFRRSKYIRGFHLGGVKNPEAAQHFKAITAVSACG